MNKDWKVFQNDVLSLLKQYQGFFETFERVGSFRDNSRPDCFARITRENKKEVWIIDAKNKETDAEDEERMQRYIENLEKNPLDVGLELGELAEHQKRGIFITPRPSTSQKFETVEFKKLHSFLQRELVYTDTDKVVRDLAKILERRELPHNHARLLNKSLKPYRNKIQNTYKKLEDTANRYQQLELIKAHESKDKLPVDAIITHKPRKTKFYFDIPYSKKEAKNNDKREEIIKENQKQDWEKVYYASINTFKQVQNKSSTNIENINQHIQQKTGIISSEKIAAIFKPKIPTKTRKDHERILVESKNEIPFQLEIQSKNDIEHKVAVKTNEDILEDLKTYQSNSMRKLGEIKNQKFIHQLKIDEDLNIHYQGSQETLESYKATIDSIYHSTVSKKLSKEINTLHNK